MRDAELVPGIEDPRAPGRGCHRYDREGRAAGEINDPQFDAFAGTARAVRRDGKQMPPFAPSQHLPYSSLTPPGAGTARGPEPHALDDARAPIAVAMAADQHGDR